MKPVKLSYKIKFYCTVWALILTTIYSTVFAQELHVVKNHKIYAQQVRSDSLKRMVELKSAIPNIVYDLRYATKNNFTGTKLYKNGITTFLRVPPAETLKKVQAELNTNGYGLKIFDAYRPYEVTKKMWDLIHDDRYVAYPSKGSGHNRGLSVDVSLINLKTGEELNMGTGFDNFSDTANHAFTNLPAAILQNRKLLKEVMEKYGFNALETEWWHYSWPNDRSYEVLDISFKNLFRYKKNNR